MLAKKNDVRAATPARLLTALLASGLVVLTGSGRAQGAVEASGEFAVPFALEESRSRGPAVLGEASLRWWRDGTPLGVGLSVGQRQDDFVSIIGISADRGQLDHLLVGGNLLYKLGQPFAGIQPFLGAGVGFARLTLDTTEKSRQYANGAFVAPQLGLRVALGESVDLTAAARYHHVYTPQTLTIVDDQRRRHFTGVGLGLGLFVRL